jgi:hypothetical protein
VLSGEATNTNFIVFGLTTVVFNFLTLSEKHNIYILSEKIYFICTRFQNRPVKFIKGLLLYHYLFLNFIEISLYTYIVYVIFLFLVCLNSLLNFCNVLKLLYDDSCQFPFDDRKYFWCLVIGETDFPSVTSGLQYFWKRN